MTPPAFIWDLDGTLFDSYPIIVSAVQQTLGECGIHMEKDGKCPLIIDSKITMPLKDFYLRENRFASLHNTDKEKFDRLCQEAENANKDKYTLLEKLQ